MSRSGPTSAPNSLRHGHSESALKPATSVEVKGPGPVVPAGTPEFDASVVPSAPDGFEVAQLAGHRVAVSSLVAATLPANSALLTWTAPVTDVPLVGYRVIFGTSPTALNKSAVIRDPSTTSAQLNKLPTGTWYFAVKSVAANQESVPSNMVSKAIP